ncbi:MAG: ATP synthase F1 subunit gamma [Acidobacteriia bacterium]|nr:ATP synthase F1 subunit gamma [Terriglobia bacterium]
MANVLDIRRRIRSVKNTQQITKAMKMVSAARLRRAQERILSARPYANHMLAVLNSLVTRVKLNRDEETAGQLHPLLAERGDQKIELVIITGDRGLCGSFNSNILKEAQQFLGERKEKTLNLEVVGRKARDFFKRRSWKIHHEYVNIFSRLHYEHAKDIAHSVIEEYGQSELDAVYLLYNEFKSVIQQRIVVERLLPIARLEHSDEYTRIDYLYEQTPEVIFNDLLPKHVEVQIYRALLESAAAEQAARMTAMDAATNNAAEMIDTLTLNMNRARQASITKEIIEIVSGAAAL